MPPTTLFRLKPHKDKNMKIFAAAMNYPQHNKELDGTLYKPEAPIIFTKADKLGPVKAKQNAAKWMNSLKEQWEELPPYFITSSEKKTGRDEVLTYIEDILKSLKEGE